MWVRSATSLTIELSILSLAVIVLRNSGNENGIRFRAVFDRSERDAGEGEEAAQNAKAEIATGTGRHAASVEKKVIRNLVRLDLEE